MQLSQARREVAEACRVLAFTGLAQDVLGHISLRVGADELLVRCRGPHEQGLLFTTPDDIHLVRFDGRNQVPRGYTMPSELPIHVEVMRARPYVEAVVHAHPQAVVTADLAGLRLRPIIGAYNIPAMRMAYDGIPVYPRSVLISRAELAVEMLAAMDSAPVCVLRGHGLTATGVSIAQAVIRALNVEALARVILGVAQAGGVPPSVPEADIAELPDLGSTLNEEHLWRYHLARLNRAKLGLDKPTR